MFEIFGRFMVVYFSIIVNRLDSEQDAYPINENSPTQFNNSALARPTLERQLLLSLELRMNDLEMKLQNVNFLNKMIMITTGCFIFLKLIRVL